MSASPQPVPAVKGVLLCLSLSALLSSLGTSIANVALPSLARAFDSPLREVQWVVLGYLLGVTVLVVVAGRLGDLLGRRRVLLAGILLFTVSAGLGALAPALRILVAARALQGAGAAAMMALTMAAVKDVLPQDATGRAMGMLGTVSAAGTALGPSLGGMLVEGFGWRAMFIAQVVPGIAALCLAHRFLPLDGPSPAGTRSGQRAAPLVDLGLFRNPVLASGFAMSLLVTAVVMATLVVGPFYLSGALALGAGRMGLTMAAGPVVAAIAGVPAGRAVDRFGVRSASLTGLAGMEAGACLLWLGPPSTPVAYAAALAFLTAGYALFQAANNTAVMEGAAPAQRGVVAGLLTLSRNLGLITGAALMTAIFVHAAGTRDLAAAGPVAVAEGFRVCFVVAASLVGCAMLIAAALAVRTLSHRQESLR
jgi:MFS family permease